MCQCLLSGWNHCSEHRLLAPGRQGWNPSPVLFPCDLEHVPHLSLHFFSCKTEVNATHPRGDSESRPCWHLHSGGAQAVSTDPSVIVGAWNPLPYKPEHYQLFSWHWIWLRLGRSSPPLWCALLSQKTPLPLEGRETNYGKLISVVRSHFDIAFILRQGLWPQHTVWSPSCTLKSEALVERELCWNLANPASCSAIALCFVLAPFLYIKEFPATTQVMAEWGVFLLQIFYKEIKNLFIKK